MKNTPFAIIDMGTNTFHLLIVYFEHSNPITLYKEKRAVKIGQGGISKGFISSDAIDRAIETMQYFYKIGQSYQVSDYYAIATSAVRSATNKSVLIDKIEETTGIKVQVISGILEATLICEGVRKSIQLAPKSLIMDIGGGSVEFIICNQEHVFWKESFEIGGQRLIDQFQFHDPITPIEIQDINTYLTNQLSPLIEAIALHKPTMFVGASGSFDTIANIDICKKNLSLDIEQIPQYLIGREYFTDIYQLLRPLSKEQRLKVAGMIDLRAEMITIACILIDFIFQQTTILKLHISTHSLKEGVLYRLQSQEPII